MNLTVEQKAFINSVILPTLEIMAVDGTLPSDLSELNYHHFEQAAGKYNASADKVKRDRIKALGAYVGEDDDEEITFESQYDLLVDSSTDPNMTLCGNGFAPVDGYEYWAVRNLREALGIDVPTAPASDTYYYDVHVAELQREGFSVFIKSDIEFDCDEDVIKDAVKQGKLDSDDIEFVDYVESMTEQDYLDATR